MPDDSRWITRETLVRRVRDRRDEKSWAEFIQYYSGYIHNIARRMGLNHHDAQEVVQIVSVRLVEKLPEFEYDPNKGRFRGWLCRVAGNEAKKFLNKRKQIAERSAEHSLADVNELQPTALEAIAQEEWRLYVAGLAWERIEKEFPATTRRAFELVSKGTDPADVARELGIAKSSVYVYKKRIADRLREEVRRLNDTLD